MGVRPIGVLSPYLAGPYFGSLISAIARVVRAAGGQVVAVQTAKPGEEYLESPTLVDVANVGWEQLAGFVTIRKAVPPAYAEALREAGKPMVAIADPGPGSSCPVVLTDNRGGVSQAVEHLLWHRHRRIAFAGCLEQFDIKQRYDAYRDTLLAHGIEPDPALFYEAPDNIESGGLDVARRMLAAGLPSTAVVAATDLNAVGIMAALRRAGRAVPQEQAIVGFDDMPGSEMLTPSLSTVSQNFDTLGALAAELLLRQLDGARLGQVSHVVAASYVKRESCGCPSDSGMQGPGEHEPRSNYAYYDLRKALRDEYLVARDLLAHRQQHPRTLQWLERTGVSAAVLGFWHPALASGPDGAPDDGRTVGDGASVVDLGSPPGAGDLGSEVPDLGMPGPRADGSGAPVPRAAPRRAPTELLVAGTFSAFGSRLALGSESFDISLFPPDELLRRTGPSSIVAVVPVVSGATNWGFLAVTAPVDSAFVNQDTTFMWAAPFAEALDHDELMRSLSESEERFALAARAANDGLWDWDLRTGTIYYSARWKEMLGYQEAAVGNGPEEWLGRVHPEDAEGLLGELAKLKVGVCCSVLHEHRVRANDGSYLWVLCRALAVPGAGASTRIVGSLTDTSERRALEEQLRQQALYDTLTGLPNRVLFSGRLSEALANTKRKQGSSFAVLWLDLDDFKELNDRYGRLVGDEVLVQVASRIRAQLREADTPARLGGDEFAVLLLDVPDPATIERVARRLLDSLRMPYDIQGHRLVLTASVGAATSTTPYARPEDVLRDADIALRRAKSARRRSMVPVGPVGGA